MIFHIITIFPEFFRGPFEYGVIGKAIQAGVLEVRIHNLRDWTTDRHKTVDDRPFGGGEGMVFKPEPLFTAVESIWPDRSPGNRVVLMSAQGRLFHQDLARQFRTSQEIVLICGRYEGVDERVVEHLCDDEISIGDYVLSGGELAATVVVDTVARLLPGVLGNEASTVQESFTEGLLDCPHWTRPAEFRGWKVPEVLLNGNHEQIRQWRNAAAVDKTRRRRPDLLPNQKDGGSPPDAASKR
ncbi:MAG TPA: tRNA (guanosine(37)-N1)-methyltransferase TrmD [Bryobacteraceae bacterium]|nr:tRNA (guanosine(37)-N1)-methyltransferase TrmD [Bryobacteraceae bacterium]